MKSTPSQPATSRQHKLTDNQHRVSKSIKKLKSKNSKQIAGEVKPYIPALYPVESTLWYLTVLDWDASRLVAGTRSITFGSDFEVRDTHLNAIIATGPALCNSLQFICCSQASFLSDTAVAKVAKACPNLVHVEFEKAVKLSDSSLLNLLKNCQNLKFVSYIGERGQRGKVTGSVIEKMIDDKHLGRSLDKLSLIEQEFMKGEWEGLIRDLSKSRRRVQIEVGTGDLDESGNLNTSLWSGGQVNKSGVL